ncbi:hypothetical protein [Paenibacillus agaridevorans]|uniref:hypothetical protein n=1 Tax=Paenibacillus agaridevorans TaxID=171404 RepID=UPI001BE43BC0|nr:hypothetical protein [Paenibacillus agaridevorans]
MENIIIWVFLILNSSIILYLVLKLIIKEKYSTLETILQSKSRRKVFFIHLSNENNDEYLKSVATQNEDIEFWVIYVRAPQWKASLLKKKFPTIKGVISDHDNSISERLGIKYFPTIIELDPLGIQYKIIGGSK